MPGLAERIVAMPEREQAHRHNVVNTYIRDDKYLKKRGQTFAMVSLILFMLFALVLVYFSQFALAAEVVVVGIVGVVGIFITGKWADKSESNNNEKSAEQSPKEQS